MDSIELLNKINMLEIENKKLTQEIQLYDCCSSSLIKEVDFLKYKLELHNIIY